MNNSLKQVDTVVLSRLMVDVLNYFFFVLAVHQYTVKRKHVTRVNSWVFMCVYISEIKLVFFSQILTFFLQHVYVCIHVFMDIYVSFSLFSSLSLTLILIFSYEILSFVSEMFEFCCCFFFFFTELMTCIGMYVVVCRVFTPEMMTYTSWPIIFFENFWL